MSSVRPPAVAGSFYPESPAELQAAVLQLLDEASRRQGQGTRPVALIVPHAGYVYSGPVAASAYEPLRAFRATIRRVILIGPAHRVSFAGIALADHTRWRTPLGSVPLDSAARTALKGVAGVVIFSMPHAREHSLEVQLPFLQTVLDRFTIVPLLVGRAEPEDVTRVLEALRPDEQTLILISSDFSHYHDYQTARGLDEAASRAILALAPAEIRGEQACGRTGIRGLLEYARRRNLRARLVDLRNSGDTAGGRDRVVGYGAFAFTGAPD